MCTENELNTLSVNGQQMKFLMDENFKKHQLNLKLIVSFNMKKFSSNLSIFVHISSVFSRQTLGAHIFNHLFYKYVFFNTKR